MQSIALHRWADMAKDMKPILPIGCDIMAGPDYILDLGNQDEKPPAQAHGDLSQDSASATGPRGKPWLSIQWTCCSAYGRIYKHADGQHYQGRCPKCQRLLKVPIGPGGTSSRCFKAT